MREAYIFDAVRTPRGKGKKSGALYTVRPVELLTTVLKAIQKRNDFDTREIEDVLIGCVTQVGEQGGCIARTAVLEAGYGYSVPAVTLNRFCASGLEALNQGVAQIMAGVVDLVVAGGVESMSRVPMGSDGGALWDSTFQWKVGSVPQGISADLLATLKGFSREDVDIFAQRSQERTAKSLQKGFFNRSIIPVVDRNGFTLLKEDEYPRADSSLEKLGQLRPAFKMMGEQFAIDTLVRRHYPEVDRLDHIHTAGNSSGIVDGASALLIGSKEKGEELGLKPRAKLISMAVVGDEPIVMLTAPIPATQKALKKAKMTISDIDLIEINEAFAVVPLNFMQAFDLSIEKINVNGGAIALGHPLGATGAMLVGTLLDALEDRDLSTGLVTLCVAGGMGSTAIIERI